MTYLLLILSVAAGVAVFLLFKPEDKRKIKLLISFSGAYVFAITVLHLLPEVYGTSSRDAAHSHHLSIGMLILLGFFLQILLEFFSHGIEHGHAHADSSGALPIGMMLGLCIHAFIEGMPLGGGTDDQARQVLLVGIIMHNIPVSIVLLSMLLHNGLGLTRAMGALAVFALMSPLGMFLSGVIGRLSQYSHELMAVVIGIFLHISTTILFESSEGHRFNRRKIVAISIGALIAIGTSHFWGE